MLAVTVYSPTDILLVCETKEKMFNAKLDNVLDQYPYCDALIVLALSF